MRPTFLGIAAADTGATGTGAGIGILLGGGVGLLAGIDALSVPGLGPLVAAGWLVATLAGAAAGAALGGLFGALAGASGDDSETRLYAEAMRRGALVTVRADDVDVARRRRAARAL